MNIDEDRWSDNLNNIIDYIIIIKETREQKQTRHFLIFVCLFVSCVNTIYISKFY
jgi:hypothetical protein